MKKNYLKPIIAFESFQLDAAVAVNCKITIGHYENQCSVTNDGIGINGPGGVFFNFFNCSIDLNGPEVDKSDSICYHGPVYTGGSSDIYLAS